MPENDDLLIKQEPIPLGSDEWEDLFPETIWPGLLPAEFPLSAYVQQRAALEFGDSRDGDNFEFDMPHEIELLIGGTLGDKFSFFGEWVMFEHGKDAPGLQRFFFQFNDLLGPKNAFNIRMGRLEPGITEGLLDNDRLTLEHATTLDYRAGGVWRPRNPQSGVEINGILNHRFQYAVGIVNGETVGTGRKNSTSDNNNRKDYYGRVAVKIGGLALDGYLDKESGSVGAPDFWTDNAVTVGVYAYKGNYLVPINEDPSLENNFKRLGVDLHINYGRFDLFSGAIFGTDNNPDGLVNSPDAEMKRTSSAVFTEGFYTIYPWLIGGLRIGRVSSAQNDNDVHKYTTFSPNVTVLVRPNVRLTLEALINSQGDRSVAGVIIPGDNEGSAFKWLKFNAMFVF